MMKIKLSFILLFLMSSSIGYSQIFASDSLSRVINIHALELISKYEKVIQFNSESKYSDFADLFHSSRTTIFNDVMPANELKQEVTPEEYIKLIKKYYTDSSFFSVEVSPYEIGIATLEGNDLVNVSILAKKKVSSISKSGLYYIDTFTVRFDIIYEVSSKQFSINDLSSVERRESYMQVFSQYRGLFKRDTLRNDTVYVNDKMFNVNQNGYTLLKNVNKYSEFLFVPMHNQVLFKMYRVPQNIPLVRNKLELKKDKNIVKINFWKWMVFADFQYHFIPNGASPIKPDNDTLDINPINTGSFSNYLMVNVAHRVSPKGYFSIKFGGGADIFNYQLNLASQVNTYPAVDPDGDPYLRINRVYNIREQHNLIYITAPLVIQKGFTFGKNSFYVQGAYYVMLKYSSFYNLDAQATYAGFYDYLFNLTISENGVYDFGTYDFKLRNLPLIAKDVLTSYSFGCGYNRKLSRTLYLDIGLNYRSSSSYMFNEDTKPLSDSKNGINSLTNLNNKFRIQYVNMNIGLSVKI